MHKFILIPILLFTFICSVTGQKKYIGKYKVTEKYLGAEDGCCPQQNPKIQRCFKIKTEDQWQKMLIDSIIILKFEGKLREFKIETITWESAFRSGNWKNRNLPMITIVPKDWYKGEMLVFECWHQ